jgi:hypothetical protein
MLIHNSIHLSVGPSPHTPRLPRHQSFTTSSTDIRLAERIEPLNIKKSPVYHLTPQGDISPQVIRLIPLDCCCESSFSLRMGIQPPRRLFC